MFRRLHIHMTLFSTLITGGILSLMAVACLLITEKQHSAKLLHDFHQQCLLLYFLSGKPECSVPPLDPAGKNNYGIDMQIHDGESPLFFDQLHVTETMEEIFTLAKEESAQNQGLNLDAPCRKPDAYQGCDLQNPWVLRLHGIHSQERRYSARGVCPPFGHPVQTAFYPAPRVPCVRHRGHFGSGCFFSWFFTQK